MPKMESLFVAAAAVTAAVAAAVVIAVSNTFCE